VFPELKRDAKHGGEVAGDARKSIEKRLGKSVVSGQNFLSGKKRKLVGGSR
jgi:DNA-damage-inducible protein D